MAVAPDDRKAYAAVLKRLVRPGGRVLFVSVEPPPFEGGKLGPPHSIERAEVSVVWKSTSVSGAPDNSSLSHFSAMTRPSWLGRAVRNRHRHAIEQASRRWRGGRRDDSATNAP